MYGIIIPYVRKHNSVHTELLFCMYGIFIPYVRKQNSVRTELRFRMYGIIIPYVRNFNFQILVLYVQAIFPRSFFFSGSGILSGVPDRFVAELLQGAYNYRNVDGISNGFQHPFTVRYIDSWARQVQARNYAGALFTSLEGGNRRGGGTA